MSKIFNQSPPIVLITGASSGIGAATALLFAERKAKLILTYHHDAPAGQAVARHCLALGATDVLLLPLDLLDDASIHLVAQTITERHGTLDILINNAGAMKFGSLVSQTFDDIDLQIVTNLGGAIKLTKELLPILKASLINIGSSLGLAGKKKLAVYSATKAGLRGFSQALAGEFPTLRIYTVNPCLTNTKMGNPAGLDPAKVAAIIFAAALGRYPEPSGADINVRDYLYGARLKKIVSFLRAIKKNFGL